VRARLWLAGAALLVSVARAEPTGVVVIAGQVAGASGAHTIHVALWDADGFLRRPVQELRLLPGAAPRFQLTMHAGRWALSAYEDRNENGVLDMGLFGPKEPSGFARAFNGWHKPRFDEVSVTVEHDTSGVQILLK
jgi:uncharacterized protein (DUF2141 family)